MATGAGPRSGASSTEPGGPFQLAETSPASPPRPELAGFFQRSGVALAEAATLEEALAVALEEVCRLTRWPVGHAVLAPAAPAGGPPPPPQRWYLAEPSRFARFRTVTERLLARGRPLRQAPMHGTGPSGGSPERGVPLFCGDLGDLPPGRRRVALEAGLRAVCHLPVRAEGRTAATAEWFLEEPVEPAGEIRDALEFLRVQLDLIAGRERARSAVRRAAARLRHLRADAQAAGEALRRTEDAYALVRQAANDGLWEWDVAEDRARFSPRWKALLGLQSAEVGEGISEWLDRVHPEDRERVSLEVRELVEGSAQRLESRHRVHHADGSSRWALVRGLGLRDEEGKVVRVAGSLTDITDLKQMDERAFRELLYHPLTGLPRPGLLLDRLEQAIRRHSRYPGSSVAVVALELEGLEEAARELGTQAREDLLLAVARRLSANLRPGDSVGLGAEFPFAVLLEGVEGTEEALHVVRRIQGSLSRPFPLEDREVAFTPHLGLAFFHPGYEKPEALLLDASLAMRGARVRGGGIQLFDPESRDPGTAVQLEADLRAALTRDELFLEYQPIVALDDGRITGLEALLRWMHPTRGLVPPDQFLPVAEQTGLIEEIGYWVLNRACRQMKEWEDKLSLDFPPSLAVNISERQFYDPDLMTTTTGILKASGLEFSRLRFDIREGVFMVDPARATRILMALKARGIRVAIDDFGTGYSSIGLLHRFPVSALKIDRWFISGQTAKLREWDVAQTTVELARILGLEVIAEGVETREQFQQLRNMGCHKAQGFFFSGPAPAAEAERLLRDGYPLDLDAPVR